MERTDELKERIRQQPLNDRLEESRRRIGDMCSKGRCPKMTIPVQHDDDDFYINTTLADAQATIAALEETILKMGENAAVVAKDAMAAKEQVAALQARVQELEAQHEDLVERNRILRHRPDLPVERTEFHDRFVKLQSQLTQRTAERDTARRRVDELEAREVDVVLLREDLEQRTAELEAAKADFVDASTDRDDWITSWRVLQRHNERIEAELERVSALVKALPKVEGEIVAQAGYVKDRKKVYACFGSDADMTAYAALLTHRQGMEG